ncbi:MAG: hypothetical protein M1833_005224 [Piccolia ochrophora]|nr:MAG: hypothetical protein M1833_005224 [Piccolia ochrophora]
MHFSTFLAVILSSGNIGSSSFKLPAVEVVLEGKITPPAIGVRCLLNSRRQSCEYFPPDPSIATWEDKLFSRISVKNLPVSTSFYAQRYPNNTPVTTVAPLHGCLDTGITKQYVSNWHFRRTKDYTYTVDDLNAVSCTGIITNDYSWNNPHASLAVKAYRYHPVALTFQLYRTLAAKVARGMSYGKVSPIDHYEFPSRLANGQMEKRSEVERVYPYVIMFNGTDYEDQDGNGLLYEDKNGRQLDLRAI